MAESGAGRNVPHFTWLCAWESEYLTAIAEKDAERQVEAEWMLTKWSTGSFYLTVMSDPSKGRVRTVLDPMRYGDPSGVNRNKPQTCPQAFIVNVRR
jgi:hypothetical protein